MFVVDPAVHSSQSDADFDPVETANRPASHPIHADDAFEPAGRRMLKGFDEPIVVRSLSV